MIVMSFKVCSKAFVSKYMQTILCLGGVKKSKNLCTTPPIILILARIPLLCTLLPPSLTRYGVCMGGQRRARCKAMYVALCMRLMHGTCCARLGYWESHPSGCCWRRFLHDLLFVIGGFWNGNLTLLLSYNDDPIIKRDLML